MQDVFFVDFYIFADEDWDAFAKDLWAEIILSYILFLWSELEPILTYQPCV